MATNIVDVVNSIAELVERIKFSLNSVIVHRVNRSLDEYVEVSGRSSVLEDNPIRVQDNIGYGYKGVLGFLDSSSRGIGFNPMRFIVSGLAFNISGSIGFIPSITGEARTGFIGVKSIRQILEFIEENNPGFLVVKNIVGEYYDLEYKDDNIGDELRLNLENNGLQRIIENSNVDGVVIDGPLYYTPRILFYEGSIHGRYAEVFKKLFKYRIDMINKSYFPIIGFVKRVEYSRKLVRCNELLSLLGLRGEHASSTITDPLLVEYIVEAMVKPPLMKPVILGPFLLRYTGKHGDLEHVLRDKVYWYIARKTPRGYQIARIEVLYDHWRKWSSEIESIINMLVSSLSLRGIPAGLEIVDKASRRLTALLYMLMYQRLSPIISLAYDEYAKITDVLRELKE